VAASRPIGIAISPDGGSVYATDSSIERVGQYNVGPGGALSPKSPATVAASTSPFGVVVSPDGRSVYVINESGTVSISQYDAAPGGALTPKSPPSFTIAGLPSSMAISPDGRSAYIGDPSGNFIWQYDVSASGILTSKFPSLVGGGEFPGSIAVTPDQAPIASFSAGVAAAGAPSGFNASSSFDPDGAVARYDWSFGDGTSALAAGPKPIHTYAAHGTYTVTLQVTDNAGCSAAEVFTGQTAYCNGSPAAIAIRTVTVPPSSSPLPAPAITGAGQSHTRWREGSKLVQISRKKRKPPVGTTFSFSLNEPASVSFAFTQRLAGRRVGHRCVAKNRRNARRRSCALTVTAGVLSFPGHTGTNKVAFQGRVSRSQKLKPGRYTLVISATNAAGVRATPVSLSFTIVK
jgi:hypothetical protein